jgi:hypothetical protein
MANKAITSDNKMTTPEDIAHVVINGKRGTQMISQCAEHISQTYHMSKYGSEEYCQINWELFKKIISIFTK